MESPRLLLFTTLFITHFTWRAGFMLSGLPLSERPLMYSRFGLMGELICNATPFFAGLSAIIAVAWGIVHMPWYAPLIMFAIAGVSFAVIHEVLWRMSPYVYGGLFVGVGPLIGILLLVLTQVALWFGNPV